MLLLLSGICNDAFATAWITNSNGNINTLGSWRDVATGTVTPGNFTTAGDTWTIQNTMTQSAAWTVTGDVTLSSGSWNAAANAVNFGGNFTNNVGSGAYISTGTTQFNGTTAQTIGGSVTTTFTNLTINNAAGVSFSGVGATASGTLALTSGTLSDGGNVISVGGNITGTGTHTSTGGGKITMTGVAKSISAVTLGNLEFNCSSASAFILTGNPSINGVLTFTGANNTWTIGARTITLNGTVSGMSATKYFTGNGASSNLTINSTSDLGTLFFNPTTPGTTDNIATFTINSAGHIVTLGNNCSVLTALALTAGTLADGGHVITNAGNITGTGTHTSSAGGKIAMTGSARNIATVTLGNVEFNNVGGTTFTLAGNPTITGTLTFTGANNTLFIGAHTLTLNGIVSGMAATKSFSGSASSNLTLTNAGAIGTIYFDQITIGTSNKIATLLMNGGGTATIGNSMVCQTALTLTSGKLAVGAGATLTINGTFTGSTSNYITGGATSGLITGGSNTYYFDQTTPGTSNNFSTFTASAGTSTLGSNLSVSTTLTLTGTLADNGNVISCSGNIAGSGTHTSTGSGKISMTGLAKSISAANLGNLEFNHTGATAFTLTGSPTVNGVLTFTGAGNTWTMGAFTLTLKGTVSGMSATQYLTGSATSNLTINSTSDLGTLFFNPTTPGTTDKFATFTMNSSGHTARLGNNCSVATTLALTAGTLNDGGHVISNAGNITGAGIHVSGVGGKITMTGATKSICNAAVTLGNLELNSAAATAYTMAGSPTITGALTITGAANTLTIGANTLNLNGTVSGMSATKYLSGSANSNLTVGATGSLGTLFFGAGLASDIKTFLVNGGGDVTIGNSMVSVTLLDLTAGSGGKFAVGAGATLTINTTFTGNASHYLIGNATAAIVTGGSNTYYFDQTTPGTSNNFSTFTASAGTSTLGNNLSVGTTLTLTGTLADNGNVITLSGNIAGAGTHTSTGSGKITMTGTPTASISGANIGNLEMNASPVGTFSLTANPTINGALTFTGTNNTLSIGAHTLTLKGTVAGMSSTKYFTGSVSSNLTINSTTDLGTMYFNSTTPGTTDKISTFTMNSAGHSATLGSNCSISTNLILTAGTLNDGGFVINNSGNIQGAGTHVSSAGGKIMMTGSAASISNAAATLGNVELSYTVAATAFTMTGSPTITGALTFSGAANRLTLGANTLTLNGTVSGMSTTQYFTGSATSNLTIGSTGALGTIFFSQTVPGTSNKIATFIMNGGGSATLGSNMVCQTAMTLTSGQLAVGAGNTLTINGTFSGGTSNYLTGSATSNLITGTSSTYYFDNTTPGTSNNFLAFTASAGTTTCGNNLSTGGITLTGTLADNGNVITCSGNVTGAGIHTSATGGKLSMTGVAKSISGANFGNLDFNCSSTSAFTMTGSPTINGNMSFTGANNTLTIGAFTLNLKGTVSGMSSTQYLTGNGASSNLNINSTSDLGTLFFNPTTPGTTDNIATFTMNSSGHSATLGNNCSVLTTLALTAGTLSDGGHVITNAGNITGAGTHTSSAGGKISMTGAAKSISNNTATLGNLELNHTGATAFTMSGGGPTIAGIFSIAAAGNTLTIGANTLKLNGTVSGMSTTQYFTGGATSNLTIGATGALGTFYLNPTTPGTTNRIATFLMNGGGSATMGNSMVSVTALTLTSGQLAVGAGNTLTVNGTFSGSTANYLTGSSTSIMITGGSNTYYFDQTTPGTSNNFSAFTASAGTSTVGNNLSTGGITLTGTLADNGNVITCSGNITGAGTHTSTGSGKLSMTGIAASFSGANYGNLEFNCSSTSAFTLTGNPTINGAFTFTGANNTLTIGARTVILNGTVSGMSSTRYFTGNGASSNINVTTASDLGTMFFNPTTPGTSDNIATFTINCPGHTATLGNNCSVLTTLALTGGTLDDGGNVITNAGNITGAGTHTSGAGGKISMTGAAKSISNAAANLGNLELNHTGATAYTMSGSPTINGALTITAAANTLTLGANTLTLNGTVSGMSATKYLTGSASSNLTLTNATALGTLFFNPVTPGTTNKIVTFTQNGAGGATLGNAVNVTTMALTTGTLTDAGNIITCTGNITGTGAEAGTGGITMTGSGGTISGATIDKLTLNNAGGFSLTGSPTVNTTLTLTAGTLTLGFNNLTLGSSANAVGGALSSSNMIIASSSGQLIKNYSANGSYTFPVGNTGSYTPVSLNVSGSGYSSANMGVNLNPAKPSQNANTTNYINRYWTVTPTGISTLSYSVTATYVVADIQSGSTETNIAMGEYPGSLPWIKFGTESSHVLTSGAVTATGATIFSGINNVAGPFPVVSANTTICNGGSTSLSATGTTGDATLSYSWAPAAGLSATTGTPVTASPTVTTTYTLTATDGNGLTATATTMVSVNPVPSSAGATNSCPVCAGASVTLSDNSSDATAWSWTGPGSYSSTVQSPAITPTVSGVYSLTVSSTGNGCNPATVYTTSVVVTPVPSSTGATNTSPICVGGIVTLNDNSSNATAWSWTGPGGYSSTLQSPTLTPTVSCVYSLVVSSTGAGCSPGTVYTTSVTVNLVPTSTGTTNNSPICVGANVTLSDNSSNATAWLWTGPGGYSSTVQSPTITPTVSGVYSLTVSSTGAGCSPGTVYTTSVTVSPLPTSTGATNTSPICVGATATLNDNSSNAAAWLWTGPGGYSSSLQSPIITPTVSGVYSLTVSSAGGGCNPPIVYTTSVTVNLVPSSTGATNTSPMCVGGTVTLNDNSSNATAWSWTGPAGYSSAVQSPSLTPTVSGVYSLTVSSIGGGCSPATVYTTSVTVNPVPSSTGATNSGPVYTGGSVTLNDNSSNATAWLWTGPDGYSSTVQSPTITPTVSGVYSLMVSSLGSGCSPATIYTTAVTVSPALPAIGGNLYVCAGATTTLTDATTGGVWTSVTPSVATIGTDGVVTGVSAGTSTISYVVGAANAVAVVTVYALPTAISGRTNVCVSSTNTLTDADAGGTWAISNTLIATIGSATGVVSAISPGIATVTYTLGTGCAATTTILSSPVAAAITGVSTVCSGATTQLSDITVGGNWTSSNPSVATISLFSGLVTAASAGTASITYALSTGCNAYSVVTVNSVPAPITGTNYMCNGGTTNLTDAGGGTWSSSNTGVATVGSTGFVASVAPGTATISYTLSGSCFMTRTVSVSALPATVTMSGGGSNCLTTTIAADNGNEGTIYFQGITPGGTSTVTPSVSQVVTVTGTYYFRAQSSMGCWGTEGSASVTINPLPASITGTASVCVGSTTTLTSATAGGTWSSSTPAKATVGSSDGVVTGVASGTTTITYTAATGCTTTRTVTVNAITTVNGASSVCIGATTTLTDGASGGTWTSSDPAKATIGSSSGLVTGVASGTTNITYALGTGCQAATTITVNALPSGITGTGTVCVGLTTDLTSATTGGTWSSSNTSNATVGSTTGTVTGVAAGTSTITYAAGTGCRTTSIVTVNAVPGNISGTASVCVGLTTSLSDATAGGTWSSSDGLLATVSTSGTVTGISAGNAVITYALGTGCLKTVTVTINPLSAVTGSTPVCVNSTVTLADATSGGTWSSSAAGTASVAVGTGIVTGVAAGTATITYLLPTGCKSTAVVTVNAIPGVINGTATVCVGLTTTLTDATGSGTWSSSDAALATIGTSGIVTGVAAGNPVISYALSTGCMRTTTLTVNALAAITGNVPVCISSTLTLNDAASGGAWSSSTTGVATVIGSTGVVTGVASGTSTITYLLGTGCKSTTVVTVNPLPAAITGTGNVCVGSTFALTDATAGGTWSSSSSSSQATVDGSGNVTGVGAGIPLITYTQATGCYKTTPVTVNPVPTSITGTMTVCAGSTTNLTDAAAGGTWSSSTTSVATVASATGAVTGVTGGTSTITYTMAAGCYATTVVTINAINPITGALSACVGSTTSLADASSGGTWASSDPSIATIGSTGIMTGVTTGTVTISYTISTGCVRTAVVAVNNTPSAILGNAAACVGYTTTLSDAVNGGTWSSSNIFNATVGSLTGIVSGVASGTARISYISGSGCFVTQVVTINSNPTGIGGATAVCPGSVINLTDFTAGGNWSSSNANATVDGSAHVTGVTAGAATISYTMPTTGCFVIYNITVNSAPLPITGTTEVCVSSVTFLTDATSGGISWTSDNTAVATVSGGGGVTGIAVGTAHITYTISNNCTAVAIVTIDPLPAAITSNSPVCAGLTLTLSDATAGGTWISGNTGVATIGSASGTITGVAGGTSIISYVLATGCKTTAIATVNGIAAITGNAATCVGTNLVLTDATAGGTWSSNNTGVATVGSTGIVSGVGTGGNATISYVLPSGCVATVIVTFNQTPGTINGTKTMCLGFSTTLTDAIAGGSWSSNAGFIAAVVGSTGVVSGILAGTATISYTTGAGCYATTLVTVNPQPSVIGGSATVCLGSTITLSDFVAGGTWSASNSNVTVDGSGHVTGVVVGNSTVTYTLPTTCYVTLGEQVNPLPTAIGGSLTVCAGSQALVTDATAPGLSWTSSTTSVATIINSGVATGIAAGTTTLTYTLPTGCFTTAVMTVLATPAAISNNTPICLGATNTLTDATAGGTWSTADAGIATVGSSTGVVTTVAAGAVSMFYTTGNGCYNAATVVVNPIYAITANSPICIGQLISLTDLAEGGTWSTSNASVATVNLSNGVVASVAPGTATITYLLGTGCSATTVVTVTSAIAAVTGAGETCSGPYTAIALSDVTPGGTWTSGDAGIATVGTDGVVTGVSAGTVDITYSIGMGCVASATVVIDQSPSMPAGPSIVCAGLSAALSDDYPDGVWSTSDGAIADVSTYTGIVTGISGGTANISYTLDNGCYDLLTVTVNPLVSLISGTTTVCIGNTDNLTDATAGGTWSSSNTGIASVGTDGIVTGIAGGSATITYTAPTGCITEFNIVVNPYAGIITGTSNVDIAAVTSLTDIIGGGTWSSSNGNATVDGSGNVTGVIAGTAVISYTVSNVCGSATTTMTVTINAGPAPVMVSGGGTFCGSTTITADNGSDGVIYFQGTTSGGTSFATPSVSELITVSGTYYFRAYSGGIWGDEGSAVVTINSVASAITGTATVCTGSTTNLTDSGGGTWASSDVSKATVGTSGIVTGVAAGTSNITYTLPTGCYATTTVTVNTSPSAITGTGVACAGLTTNLTDSTAGGTWVSNNALIATVGSTGIVTGVGAGNTTITYTIGNGCYATTPITINPLPAAITGNGNVCLGSTTNLTDATVGGAWSSSDIATAIVSTGGVVTGVATGNATITYTMGSGCITTTPITVNPLPATISGTTSACAGSASNLTDATAGGTWSSGNGSVATVGSSTGVVSGVAAGVTQITYTLPTGCIAVTNFSVFSLPATTTTGGTGTFCGSTTVTGSNGGDGFMYFQGTTSGGTSTATAGTSQVVSASGTYYFRALSGSGCWGAEGSVSVTINPLPAAISGTNAVCVGSTTSLTNVTAGGTWSSSDVSKATIGSTGIVTGVAAGTSTITYTSATGCIATIPVAVNPLPGSITGTLSLCAGSTSALGTASTGGLWSSGSLPVATIGSATGVASGVSGGVAGITYTLPTGCITTANLTVNALPATVIASGGGTFCGSTTITAANGGDGTIYYQGTTSGGTSTGTPSVSQPITSSGTYYFRAQSASGCWGAQGSVSVTINPLPAAVSGPTTLCIGSGYTLTDATAGGTWSSSNAGVATIGSSDGIIATTGTGTSNITYTLPTGCTAATTVTVNPLPAAITGTTTVCLGQTTALTDATAGGTWTSGNTFVATVGSTGIVSGLVSGNATITYTLGTGCIVTDVVTVNPLPSAIIGSTTMCLGTNYNLTDGVAGGNWSSSTLSVGTIDGGGVVTTLSTGTSTISYTLPTGCSTSVVITVNPVPAAITGTNSVCTGAVTALTDATAGGAWSSADDGTATVSSGSVTGVAAGVTTISYVLGTGCYATTPLTVNQSPAAITGTATVCQGLTTALTNSVAGGIWSSSTGAVATVGTSGVVTGVSGGTSTISYALGSCVATRDVTVNPIAAITGNVPVCINSTITLTDAVAGGTWTSGSISIASIGTDGVVTGLNFGTSIITYTLSTGCTATTIVTVNQLPQVILGAATVCGGQSITLSDLTTGGTWTSNNITIATAGSATGIITGGAAGGNTTITYTLATGCYTTKAVTVYPFSAITGSSPVCVGFTVALTDATAGGTWSSSNASIATVGTGGVVTGVAGGNATISYVMSSTGCTSTSVVTINALPSAITGTLITCVGMTTALTDAGGGTWASGTPAVATIGTDGIVTGAGAGTSGITYTLPTGCTTTAVVTINAVPTTINGTLTMCAGSATTLTDAITGGTWSSSNTSNATVGVTSGVVTGVAGGTATITYTMAAGCFITTTVTVNPILPITGVLSACVGSTTTLADGSAGGTWSSSDPSTATVGSSSGIVSGILTGTITISYTIPSGCVRTATVVINPLPGAVNGTMAVCVGATTTLTDATGSGTWSSSNLSVASVIAATGVVTGVGAGTSTITYTAGSGCYSTAVVTVNPTPSSIGGASSVCVGSSVTLSDFVAGGTWSSSNSNATVGSASGIVTGVTAGASTITYTLTSTGCFKTFNITINNVPAPIGGASTVCVGVTGFETDATGGGISWTSSNTAVATITNSGAITGVAGGTTTITYTVSTGCYATTVVTVNSSSPAITGNTPVCAGSTITLTDVLTGGTWTSNTTSVATVGSGSGVVTGVAGGTSQVSYIVNGACPLSVIVTVNPILAITGSTTACVGSTTALADATAGGTWSSGNTGIATVGSSTGVVTGVASGSTTIIYTLPTGCSRTVTVTINPMTLITGTPSVCAGLTTALTNATAGGTWSSSNVFVATVATSGLVTGVAAGTSNITYSLSGCLEVQQVTVNATPSSIGGSSAVCTGATVTLSDFLAGGTWSTSNGNATVGSASGVVTGVTAGASVVSYVMPGTGCFKTFSITINQSPSAIAGAVSVAVGAVAFVNDPSSGGISWSSSNTGVATISGSGAVTGVSVGTTNLTYTVSTGCIATKVFTVTAMAPHTPDNTTRICVGSSVVLEEANAGGTWSSSNSNVAIVDPISGQVTGTGVGRADISYWLVSGFGTYIDHKAVQVDPLPDGVVISADPGTNIGAGEMLTLSATVNNGGDAPAYQWLVNNVPVDGATSATFVSNTFADNDSVTCAVISSGTCSGYVVEHTVVIRVGTLGINTGLAAGSDVRLLPNPSKGEFIVKGTFGDAGNQEVTIEITDVLGQVIYKHKVAATDGTINEKVSLSGTLANGMYMLNLRSGTQSKVFHFVIEK